ncbi:hypothetical protein WA171_004691 [Blastocystis sp. BT1]
MIKALIIVSMNGQPRLSKFYDFIEMDKRKDIIRRIYDTVVKRSEKLCNFVEDKNLQFWSEPTKIVYRKVSSIIVCLVADESESELGLLDLIQVLMDVLEESFEGLREYDLIYNIDKVHSMFDEIIMGGLVLETNVDKIMATINAKNSLEYKMEDSTGRLPTVK